MFKNFSKKIQHTQKLFSIIVIVALLFGGVPTDTFAQATETPTEDQVTVPGCTDGLATNYLASATEDDGSCLYPTEDQGEAVTADGEEADSVAEVSGCIDETANNYNTDATVDDGSCTFDEVGEESPDTPADVPGCTDETANNYNLDATLDDGSCTYDPAPDDTASSSDDTASTTNNAANDGVDGDTGTSSADTASSTATTTNQTGSEGADGTTGGDGTGGTGDPVATTSHAHTEAPIPFVIDELIGDTSDGNDATDNQEDQGGERERGEVVTIGTGIATAKGEVSTKANSSNIRSIADEAAYRDLDNYRFYQMSPNEANVINEVAADAYTGRNQAIARQEAEVTTGDAIATFNIANVVNTNIINSDGYLYLANQILEEDESLDLQDFFFPGGSGALAEANGCTLNSCLAESIEYNFLQTNHATVTNDAHLRANTGGNYVTANRADISTGDAYAAANVVNVVNTNIVDSNYRLLTFNAVGDLDGDLILPTEELFDAFFGLPNGLNQLQVGEGEDGTLNVDNQNEVDINNNVDTYAESGLNEATAIDSSITTGRSESESNVLNKVNDNVFGGDLMYLWIRVHGSWSGDVVGLPDGLAWEWGPEGIIIYNADAEVTPSEFLGYDLDAYTANVQNFNNVAIYNNVYVDAISGRNEVDNGLIGSITTGNTFASANVMNIANTNVIGANWTMAIVNVLGDFDGNVTFARTDLVLEGLVTSDTNPVGPNSLLTYTYTVANSTDQVATNVVLSQALNGATNNGISVQTANLGDINPGNSVDVEFTALVDSTATTATKDVVAVASVTADEGDANQTDNEVVSRVTAYYDTDNTSDLTDQDLRVTIAELRVQVISLGGTASNTDTSGMTTEELQAEVTALLGQIEELNNTPVEVLGCTDSGAQNYDASATTHDGSCTYAQVSSGGGGGGGRSRNKDDDDDPKAEIERIQSEVDPDSPPKLSITKVTPNATGTIEAGVPVEYVITVTNDGGYAYDAVVEDVLTNPIGEVLNTDSWDLGTILPGEEIALEYTTAYQEITPSGLYTNTASLIAYDSPTSTRAADAEPLPVASAVHKIDIKGVGLAVGNVDVLAYFPLPTGGTGALVTWQTSKPSEARIHYSPTSVSPFRVSEPNFGYQYSSAQLPGNKTTHAMVLTNLLPGTEYTYHVSASDGTYQSFGGPYTFSTPFYVGRLTLANQVPQVAGASISTPDQQATAVSSVTVPSQSSTPKPAPQPAVVTNVTPPAPQPKPAPDPKPEPKPEPAPEPEPKPEPAPEPEPSGLFGKVKESVFGWFR